MHNIHSAAIVAAHHIAAQQHTTGYWVTGIVISLIVGVIAALVSAARA